MLKHYHKECYKGPNSFKGGSHHKHGRKYLIYYYLQIIEEVGSSPLSFDKSEYADVFNHEKNVKNDIMTTFVTDKDAGKFLPVLLRSLCVTMLYHDN